VAVEPAAGVHAVRRHLDVGARSGNPGYEHALMGAGTIKAP